MERIFMKAMSRTRQIAAALALYSLILGIYSFLRADWLVLSSTVVPVLLGLYLWFGMGHAKQADSRLHLEGTQPSAAEEQERSKLYLRTLNHQRHDFMNDIQVIFGYLRLNKYDKILDFVENMKHKAERESMISKLGSSELSLYLHSFRARHSLELEVEMDQAVNLAELPIEPDLIGHLTISLIESVVCLGRGSESLEKVALELYTEEDALYVCLELYGSTDVEELEEAVARSVEPYRDLLRLQLDTRIDQHWATVEVAVPLRNESVTATA
jgi:stage 0 sporulation protein B (sporulation initiation phosphotransferase)